MTIRFVPAVPITTEKQLAPLSVRLDWKAYWRRFQQEHGEPVPYGDGRLLFPDGWQYSALRYGGPEWPPPTDPEELLALQRTYWRTRLAVVTAELRGLERQVADLVELQRVKSVPLQQVLRYNATEGKAQVERVDLDLSALQGRIAWLRQDVTDCQAQLARLEPDHAEV